MSKVVSRTSNCSRAFKRFDGSYKESEDLINVGAYAQGSNPKVDKAIAIYNDLLEILQQKVDEGASIESVFEQMIDVARKAEAQVDPSFLQPQDGEDGYNEMV
jgi:flagellum-specific ATP synthase